MRKLSIKWVEAAFTVCAVLALVVGEASAQPQIEWAYSFGGLNRERCWDMVPTREGGYAISARFDNGPEGQTPVDAYLVVTDSVGDVVIEQTYDADHGASEEPFRLTQTNDGGYLMVGESNSSLMAIRVDSSGAQLWYRTYPQYGSGIFYGACTLVDGTFLLAGWVGSNGGDGCVMKIDNRGDEIWWRTFGSPNQEALNTITTTSDGEFLVAGIAYLNEDVGIEEMVLKVTADGDSVWMKTYGTEVDDIAAKIVELSDGGLAIAGFSGDSHVRFSFDYYLARLTEDGDLVWTRTYGGPNDQKCNSLIVSSLDGGFLLSGTDGRRGHVNWLVRTDSTGEELWTLDFGDNSIDGFTAVTETPDHCYVMAGTSDNGNNLDDIYLVKTTPDPLSINAVLLDPAFPSLIALDAPFPNPFNSTTTISYTLSNAGWTRMDVMDLNGRLVTRLVDETAQQAGHYAVSWDATRDGAGSGIYFLKLQAGGDVRMQKMMMVK